MKSRQGWSWFILGLLSITAALFLTVNNLCEDGRAGKIAVEMAAQLENTIPAKEKLTLEIPVWAAEPELPDYVLNPDMEMPVKRVNGQDYIGVLEIPSLSLELPVISEWSYPGLKIAPCRFIGSAYQDNLVIAAHNYQSHFGLLKTLSGGEEVIFTDMDGNVFRYEVALVEVLEPTAVEEMESGEWELSLFTCTTGGAYRVAARCRRSGNHG